MILRSLGWDSYIWMHSHFWENYFHIWEFFFQCPFFHTCFHSQCAFLFHTTVSDVYVQESR